MQVLNWVFMAFIIRKCWRRKTKKNPNKALSKTHLYLTTANLNALKCIFTIMSGSHVLLFSIYFTKERNKTFFVMQKCACQILFKNQIQSFFKIKNYNLILDE